MLLVSGVVKFMWEKKSVVKCVHIGQCTVGCMGFTVLSEEIRVQDIVMKWHVFNAVVRRDKVLLQHHKDEVKFLVKLLNPRIGENVHDGGLEQCAHSLCIKVN